jgi:hypothetical protein
MTLTKLPLPVLGRNNSVMTSLFPPRESLVVTSRLRTGNSRTFFYGAERLNDRPPPPLLLKENSYLWEGGVGQETVHLLVSEGAEVQLGQRVLTRANVVLVSATYANVVLVSAKYANVVLVSAK